MSIQKPELLSPAGSLDKLKTAILFGADAVYCGGLEFGLRSASKNFTEQELREGLDFAHARGARVFVTVNVFARNQELERLGDYVQRLEAMGVDAVIVSDLGVFSLVRSRCPGLEIHVSTQANNVNYASCNAWHELGAARIILARELSLAEMAGIRAHTPESLLLEVFVHGAMCVSYSGRCLLSNYLAGRDANHGNCAQPCRWQYALVEEQRPGEYYPVFEDERGTHILNSKDLCLIRRIPELIAAGVGSLKIEGRVKSEYYVATVTAAYRRAIDSYCADPDSYSFDQGLYEELCKVSHRAYCEGFLDGALDSGQIYGSSSYIRDYEVVALVRQWNEATGTARCSQRNKFSVGDKIEALRPDGSVLRFTVEQLRDAEGASLDSVPHPDMDFSIWAPEPLPPFSMLRKRSGS